MSGYPSDFKAKPTELGGLASSLIATSLFLANKGWLPATAGNLSARTIHEGGQDRIVITKSGADKGRLTEEDILVLDSELVVHGNAAGTDFGTAKPSAETKVHALLYNRFSCGCILHVHTVYNNLASEIYGDEQGVPIARHELLKALGHWEEDASITVPIVENLHHIPALAKAVCAAARDDVPGVLVRNHGIYAWGDTIHDAVRHLEAFEFLFEYEVLLKPLQVCHRMSIDGK